MTARNEQSVPMKLCDAFVRDKYPEGVVQVDYAELELRVLAHLGQNTDSV